MAETQPTTVLEVVREAREASAAHPESVRTGEAVVPATVLDVVRTREARKT